MELEQIKNRQAQLLVNIRTFQGKIYPLERKAQTLRHAMYNLQDEYERLDRIRARIEIKIKQIPEKKPSTKKKALDKGKKSMTMDQIKNALASVPKEERMNLLKELLKKE